MLWSLSRRIGYSQSNFILVMVTKMHGLCLSLGQNQAKYCAAAEPSEDSLSQLLHHPKWCLLLLLLLLLGSVIRLRMIARECKNCRACLSLLHDDDAESTKAEASHWVLSGLHTESVTGAQV